MKYRIVKLRRQSGTSLIEVLVSILLLSFGMLSLGAMLSFAIQMPKLSGYRATATNVATSHIERIRANPGGFQHDAYRQDLSYDGTSSDIALSNCTYPNCDEASLAAMDNAATKRAVRIELPAGGMLVTCDTTPCAANSYGNLWIIWQEPRTQAALDSAGAHPAVSDNCPAEVTTNYTDPKPRCLYVRFKA